MAFITYMADLPFPSRLFAVAILVLGVGCLTLIILLYSRRAFSLMQERNRNDRRFRYQYFLYDALVESQTGDDAPDFPDIALAHFREEEQKQYLDKQVLTNLLIDLKRSFSGSSEEQLLRLAEALDLPQYAYQKLQHRHWSTQVQGIREINGINASNDTIRPAIVELSTSKVPILSQEAQIALVKLSNPPDLSFLDSLSLPLSHWQQMRLFHHLRTVRREDLPDFSRWLSSDNESVILFALRMVTEFEQHYATPLILQQLTHPSARVILEAIRTVKQLRIAQATDQLMFLFRHTDPNVQLSSLQAIGQLGSTHHLRCLQPFLTHHDYWIRRAAAEAQEELQRASMPPTTPATSSLQPLN